MSPITKQKAFTLIEILIVVSILGILAAIVFPQFSHSATKAKEAAAKEILQRLRTQIGLYKAQHNGLMPGSEPDIEPYEGQAFFQLVFCTSKDGTLGWIKKPTDDYPYGPYFIDCPINPFNGHVNFETVSTFPAAPSEDENINGWVYCDSTGQIRLNSPGNDSENVPYYDY